MSISEQNILRYIAEHPGARRSEIRRNVAPEASQSTIWRFLKRLVDDGRLEVSGRARASGYSLAGADVVRMHLQIPYNHRRIASYRKEFIDSYVPDKSFYLNEDDRQRLHAAGRTDTSPLLAVTYAQRILERLLVDLSWASSRMEGNTYDILETERLIRFGEEAIGKDRKEAVMILNHKEAIDYVVKNLDEIAICRGDVFNIHALLADGLLADPAMAGCLRRLPVAITHSSYRPIDDRFEIDEEFEILIEKAAAIADPFEQSFFLLVHIPYLQAFADVNKRASRVASNIPLLKAGLAPMSFVVLDDHAYIDGLIGVYELNNVSLLRDVYIDAYLHSAESYRVLHAELESPEKAALVYRKFVREAVRRCVLEWKCFRQGEIEKFTVEAEIPEADQGPVVDYVARECRSLHEGNAIRYQLKPEDLVEFRCGGVEERNERNAD